MDSPGWQSDSWLFITFADIIRMKTRLSHTSGVTLSYRHITWSYKCHLLQDNLLLVIFSSLDAISLCKVRGVCHRWLDLSTDEVLWKHKLMSDVGEWRQVSHHSFPDHETNTDPRQL